MKYKHFDLFFFFKIDIYFLWSVFEIPLLVTVTRIRFNHGSTQGNDMSSSIIQQHNALMSRIHLFRNELLSGKQCFLSSSEKR